MRVAVAELCDLVEGSGEGRQKSYGSRRSFGSACSVCRAADESRECWKIDTGQQRNRFTELIGPLPHLLSTLHPPASPTQPFFFLLDSQCQLSTKPPSLDSPRQLESW